MKNVFIVLISVIMLTSYCTPVRAESESKPAVVYQAKDQPSAWAVSGVTSAIESGLVPKELQSLYKSPITREQFTSLVVTVTEKLVGYTLTYKSNNFTDSNAVTVNKAFVAGIVNGVGNGKFNPSGLITREQIAVMYVNALQSLDTLQTGVQHIVYTTVDPKFSDKSAVSTWAVSSVALATDNVIVAGVGNNKFDAKGSATREQAILIAYRVYSNMLNESHIELLQEKYKTSLVSNRVEADWVLNGNKLITVELITLFGKTNSEVKSLLGTVESTEISFLGAEYENFKSTGVSVHYLNGIAYAVSLRNIDSAFSGTIDGLGKLCTIEQASSKYPGGLTSKSVTSSSSYTLYTVYYSGKTYEFIWDSLAVKYYGVTVYSGDYSKEVIDSYK